MLDTKNIEFFRKNFPSIKNERKKIVDIITSTINDQKLPLLTKNEELYLVIDEAITNAMEHGNKWQPEKVVEVVLAHDSKTLEITITDQGQGFDPALNGKDPLETDIFRKRGRGLFIISRFCETRWNKKGNSITLIFPLKNA